MAYTIIKKINENTILVKDEKGSFDFFTTDPNFFKTDEYKKLREEVGLKPVRFSKKRKRHIPTNIRLAVLNRDKSTCQLCGKKAPDVDIEVDHIIPFSKGGSNKMNNLQCLCFECNIGKSNRYDLHMNE